MNRRGFLQALFAVPVIAAPLLLPVALRPAPSPEPLIMVVTKVDREAGEVTFSSMTKREALAFEAASIARGSSRRDLRLAALNHMSGWGAVLG